MLETQPKYHALVIRRTLSHIVCIMHSILDQLPYASFHTFGYISFDNLNILY